MHEKSSYNVFQHFKKFMSVLLNIKVNIRCTLYMYNIPWYFGTWSVNNSRITSTFCMLHSHHFPVWHHSLVMTNLQMHMELRTNHEFELQINCHLLDSFERDFVNFDLHHLVNVSTQYLNLFLSETIVPFDGKLDWNCHCKIF